MGTTQSQRASAIKYKSVSPGRIVRVQLLTTLAALVLCTPAALAVPFFQGLGDLPGGNFFSVAQGISGNGAVVAGVSNSASGREAFRWTSGGGIVGLGDLPGGTFYSATVAGGVLSHNGAVVVGDSVSAASTRGEAFRWQSGAMSGLGDLSGGFFQSFARAVSGDGAVVVGGGRSASGYEAFRWTAGGGITGLGDLSGGDFFSLATGISGDGLVVVGHGRSALGDEAFRWTSGGGMIGLGDLPGGAYGSIAQGVSADGTVLVGSGGGASGTEAFRWTAGGGMVGLGYVTGSLGTNSALRAVSADGSTAVGYDQVSASEYVPTIWDDSEGMRNLQDVLVDDFDLDLTGWMLQMATGVSADGLTYVGWGINPDGNTEGWIASVSPAAIPAPGTILLVLLGLLAFPRPRALRPCRPRAKIKSGLSS